MKPTTTVRKTTLVSSLNLARIGALLGAGVVALTLAPAGCTGGWDYSDVSEGNRCNPYDSHNECASGLACTVSAWQVANQGMLANTGTLVPFLAPGAGADTAGNYDVLEFCPENYCCPVDGNGDLTTSGNPYCQPGCAGGAAAICAAVGDSTPPYVGVCDFAATGMVPAPDAGEAVPDAGSGDGSTE
jgi:hypothetical protein